MLFMRFFFTFALPVPNYQKKTKVQKKAHKKPTKTHSEKNRMLSKILLSILLFSIINTFVWANLEVEVTYYSNVESPLHLAVNTFYVRYTEYDMNIINMRINKTI